MIVFSPAELTRVAMEMVWMNMATQHFNLVHHPVMLPSGVSTQPYFLLVIYKHCIDQWSPITESMAPFYLFLFVGGFAFSQEDHGITGKVNGGI